MNDDSPYIQNFTEQVAEIDAIAKRLIPTRNKDNVEHFMSEVERTFKEKGWNFSEYCKKVTIDSYDRKHPTKLPQKTAPGNISDEMKNLFDNMGESEVKSVK